MASFRRPSLRCLATCGANSFDWLRAWVKVKIRSQEKESSRQTRPGRPSKDNRDARQVQTRFIDEDARRRNVDALEEELQARLRQRDVADWLERMEREGIPFSPVNDIAAAVNHPQVRARDMVVEIDDPAVGKLYVAGNPIKLSGAEHPPRRPPPELDADRDALLAELRRGR